MNYFRTLISKNKRRFVDRKYNLDLSYITPRIIVMSYPTSFPQSLIRNNINEVANFLNERHGNNYLLINLSNKEYDISKFNGQVLEYKIMYNMPPYLNTIFDICEKIHDFLENNLSNVVIINCRGGKGRVGTIVCSYLLYIKKFNETKDAFDYYSLKRLYKGEGISQPNQKRYINYFHNILLKEKIYFPMRIRIISFELKNMYEVYDKGYYYIEIWDCKKDEMIIYDISPNNYVTDIKNKSVLLKVENILTQEQYGDIVIKIYYKENFFNEKLGKFSFNTAFLDLDFDDDEDDKIFFNKYEIDPDNLLNMKKVPENYQIIVNYKKLCIDCPTKDLEDYCKDCKSFINNNKHLYDNWNEIINHKKKYKEKKITYNKNILFGTIDSDDCDFVLKKEEKNKSDKIKQNYEGNKNYYEENNDSNSSEYSEGEDYEDKYENNNEENRKKDKLNDSFESECFIF